jgi:hypothetical protein
LHLVQLVRQDQRVVGIADGASIRIVDNFDSVYRMALAAIEQGKTLEQIAADSAGAETLDYDACYEGKSPWRFLPSFDHPDQPARCLVSGTGLTHKASAENRSAMHQDKATLVTDSMRMYRMGLEGGNPPAGQIGVQPEWFYKGNGSILRAHGEALDVPAFGEDGGEEPEIAGAYLIGPDGKVYRAGLTIGNEFSDHKMEKRNYLYLAPSKLRNCSIGPELVIGKIQFDKVEGEVAIKRGAETIWAKKIFSGETNMSHSVANLEHHHFKYEAHRRPGDVHIHFFGADAFSFGEGVTLKTGDITHVAFAGFGRPLQNRIAIYSGDQSLVAVSIL